MKNAGFRLSLMVALTLCFLMNLGVARAQELDPVKDLAGVLLPGSSPSTDGRLYVMPSDEGGVLVALHAVQIGPDRYQATLSGSSITFLLLRAILPAFYLPPGDLICQTMTYKVYKNASCQTTITGGTQGCQPYTGGNYATLTYNPTRKCKVGSGYCVENFRVLWIRNVYSDNTCSSLIAVQTGNDFMCN